MQIYKDLTILYHTSIQLYLLASRIAGLFSKKAAQFYRGRKGLLSHIKQVMSSSQGSSGTRYWFHCASVGEFEQARPLIEKIKEREPNSYIVLTFFSPSGYELRKNYPLASAVFYLPMDTKRNAKKFVEYVKPQVVIFIKYEFWRNYFKVLKELDIPLYLVSAIFRETQPFFKWWGGSFRKILKNCTHLFVQDTKSKSLLSSIGITNVSVAGDTRFDRVFEITQNNQTIAALDFFTSNVESNKGSAHICCVAGSTWPLDEELLALFMKQFERFNSNQIVLKLVIAPHEIDKAHIKKIESLFAQFRVVKFSSFSGTINKLQRENLLNAQVFILDTVGLLSTAYRYGSFAYVGGGFGVGIHNILEAATYGLPVVFGPKYEKFKEAVDLISLGGAFTVNKDETEILEKFVLDVQFRESCSTICSEYVKKNKGATANILNAVAPK